MYPSLIVCQKEIDKVSAYQTFVETSYENEKDFNIGSNFTVFYHPQFLSSACTLFLLEDIMM